MKCFFVALMLFNLSAHGNEDLSRPEEYEALSTKHEHEASQVCEHIKSTLRKAKEQSSIVREVLLKFKSNPQKYDKVLIQNEWDEELDNLKKGQMCSKCRKTKKQLTAEGTNFEDHVSSVGGVIEKVEPTQEDYDKINNLYQGQIDEVDMLNSKLINSKSEREKLILSTFALKESHLYPAFTKSYNSQLKVYSAQRQITKEQVQTSGEMLVLIDDMLALLEKASDEYKEYSEQQYSLVLDMKKEVRSLNEKRIQINSAAEKKLNSFLQMENSIKQIALELGDEIFFPTTGSFAATVFSYPQKNLYLPVRGKEELGVFLPGEIAQRVEYIYNNN